MNRVIRRFGKRKKKFSFRLVISITHINRTDFSDSPLSVKTFFKNYNFPFYFNIIMIITLNIEDL